MALNRFNTTPATHPSLYNNGMYMGKCRPLSSGQPVSPSECARVLAVAAVGYGWSVGDVALQVARTLQRRMGIAIYPDEEQAHGVAACAYAAEIRRRIVASGTHEDVLRSYNEAVEEEMPYNRYGYDGESSHSGGALFSKFFGAAGNHIYSEFAAVNGDIFGTMMQKIRALTSNMLSRVTSNQTPHAEVPVQKQSGKPKIIKCPNCGRDVSTESKTCWCCDAPITQGETPKAPGNKIDAILREVSSDYDAYTQIPVTLLNEYPFLAKHQSHEFALQVAMTMIMYAVMKYVAETKRQDKYTSEMIQLVFGFSSAKYQGGKQMLQDVAQYQGDYVKKCVNECGGQFLLPYHLKASESEEIVRSCEKICFPYIHCLVMSTFGNEYNGSSANFFRHFISRAEKRYEVYRPLLAAYYNVLKEGGELAEKVATEHSGANVEQKKTYPIPSRNLRKKCRKRKQKHLISKDVYFRWCCC